MQTFGISFGRFEGGFLRSHRVPEAQRRICGEVDRVGVHITNGVSIFEGRYQILRDRRHSRPECNGTLVDVSGFLIDGCEVGIYRFYGFQFFFDVIDSFEFGDFHSLDLVGD